jgi:acyl carrier protein
MPQFRRGVHEVEASARVAVKLRGAARTPKRKFPGTGSAAFPASSSPDRAARRGIRAQVVGPTEQSRGARDMRAAHRARARRLYFTIRALPPWPPGCLTRSTDMIDAAAIEQTIKEYLVDKAGVAPALVEDPKRKLADFALDSLSVIEMLFEVEDRYGVHVDDPMTLKEFDLEQLYQLIGKLVAEKQVADAAAAARAAQAEAAAAVPAATATVGGGASA